MNTSLLERLTCSPGATARPIICLEINPPRGTDWDPVFERLKGCLAGIDLLNVTDSALARMRSAALPFAARLKQVCAVEPVVNVSCRDRNLIALQGDLLAGWALGVRSVVALTGDAVSIGDSPDRKGVFEINSIGLLGAIATLNGGKDLAHNELSGATNYVPGVVVNPNARNVNAELKRLQRKKDAGARYALSQPVFDAAAAESFLTAAQSIGVPILLGVMAFKSAKSILGLSAVPGIRVPEDLVREAEAHPDADFTEPSIARCLDIVKRTRRLAAGFHVVSGVAPRLALRLAADLVTWRDSEGR